MATQENPTPSEKKTLILKSSDGEEFIVPESAAILSVIIKNMVEAGCADGVIPVQVDGKTLATVTTYLKKHAQEGATAEEKRKFHDEFLSEVDQDAVFDFFLAANYLEIKCLLHLTAEGIASLMKNKSPNWVRKFFGIENDFTPEQEEVIKKSYPWAWAGVDPDDDD